MSHYQSYGEFKAAIILLNKHRMQGFDAGGGEVRSDS